MSAVTYPLRTVSESNSREHWAPKAKRVKAHRLAAFAHVTRSLLCPLPIVVTLVRIAPRALDDDNLRGALKATRDGVADAFGVNDRDPMVQWVYAQRRGEPKAFAVEIGVRRATDTADAS
jgi:hypothetical protein